MRNIKLNYLLIPTLVCLIFNESFAQDTLIYNTKYLSKPDTVLIFKPQQYSAKKNWPLLYLLHGYGGNYNQWNSIIDAQSKADKYGFIIVCPDGNSNSWYINSPLKKDSQFENFFYEDLFPDISRKYTVNPDQVFISGLSMGGQGALNLFIKKPELFLSAGSTSGVMDLYKSSDKYGLTSLIGSASDSLNWKNFSIIDQIKKLSGSKKALIFDCGTQDPFYESNIRLMEKCNDLGLNATFISQPGKHNREYWQKSIIRQLDFFKSQISD
ncbi:MAG: alpha/beta hydrolase family protein [Daejeonella sp.]